MRFILIGVVGGIITASAFVLGRLSDHRSVRVAFLFAAIVTLVLTVGSLAAAGFSAWDDRRRWPKVVVDYGPVRSRPRVAGDGDRCGSCARRMTRVGELLLCPVCDRAPV